MSEYEFPVDPSAEGREVLSQLERKHNLYRRIGAAGVFMWCYASTNSDFVIPYIENQTNAVIGCVGLAVALGGKTIVDLISQLREKQDEKVLELELEELASEAGINPEVLIGTTSVS